MARTQFRSKGKGRNRKVYPVTSSSGKRKSSMTTASVIEIQQKRSVHARRVDNAMKAKATSKEQWARIA